MMSPKLLSTDVVIIGCGVAGLTTALHLPKSLDVLLVSKVAIQSGSTFWAQGGIAGALASYDTATSHMRDTLLAGDGLCDEEAVRILVHEGADALRALQKLGMPFDEGKDGLHFTKEAAHSVPRVIHAGGDATGRHLSEFLILEAIRRKRLKYIECCTVFAIEPCTNGFALSGVYDGTPIRIDAKVVVIATGGAGQAFTYTTNPPEVTGDGIQLATDLDLAIRHLEFYQFHPTAFYPPVPLTDWSDRLFLISESVRGEGAILRNTDGDAFMERYAQEKELAPRDVVARAIFSEMQRTKKTSVFLDLAHLDPDHIRERFPTIVATCALADIELPRDPIPVTPVAHFMMGGIATTIDGETSLPGIYAVGEVASTGVHGANRLASNSLLEGLVFGKRTAEHIVQYLRSPKALFHRHPVWHDAEELNSEEQRELRSLQQMIRSIAWEKVGITRTGEGLQSAIHALKTIEHQYDSLLKKNHTLAFTTRSLSTFTHKTAMAALHRTHSVGAHYRADGVSMG